MGFFRDLVKLGKIAVTTPAPIQKSYEEVQAQADKKYVDKPADKEMFNVTTDYLLQDKERTIDDEKLNLNLKEVANKFTNSNLNMFKKQYPIEEITVDYDNIKTSYERSKQSNTDLAVFWGKEEEKRREAWNASKRTHDSPETIAMRAELDRRDNLPWDLRRTEDMRNARDLLWEQYVTAEQKNWEDTGIVQDALRVELDKSFDKRRDYEYNRPKKLKAKPLSELDVRIYLNRIKDPEEKKYFTALTEDTKKQYTDRLGESLDPKWIDPKLSNIAGAATGVSLEILEAIDRTNLSMTLADSPTRRFGFKPAWDSENQKLTTMEDPYYEHENAQDSYIWSTILGRERFSPNEWLKQKFENLLRGGKAPTMYDSFAPDDMYSLLGEQGLAGAQLALDDPHVDRTEWDDQKTKSHELLHRYFRLAPFNKDDMFFGKGNQAYEEFFIRAYVKKINGEEIDDEFYIGLKNHIAVGNYSNVSYNKNSFRDEVPFNIGSFKRAMPSMIENFEAAVLGKWHTPAVQLLKKPNSKSPILSAGYTDNINNQMNKQIDPVDNQMQDLMETPDKKWSEVLDQIVEDPEERDLFRRIIDAESKGDPTAVSKKGAKGLMQIMAATAKQPGYKTTPFQGDDLFNVEENIRFGTDYMRNLKNYFGDWKTASIAYNWGPGNTTDWITAGSDFKKLPKETQDYIQKIYK